MYELVSTSGDLTFEVPAGGPVVVGRAATTDAPVPDPTVSRRHAELSAGPEGLHVQDLGSSNGTFINGVPVTEGDAVDEDVISFGRVSFTVRARQAAAETVVHAGGDAAAATGDPGQAPPAEDSTPVGAIVRERKVEAPEGLPEALAEESATPALERLPEDDRERRQKTLEILLEISKELSRQEDVDRLLEKVVDFTFQTMDVDRASILLLEGAGELVPRISRKRGGDQSTSRHVPRSIANKSIRKRVALLTDNALQDERFLGRSIVMQRVRSAMCTPLIASDQSVLGILYVDNRTSTKAFDEEDLEFLTAFGGLAAVGIENSQLSERLRREALALSNFQRYFAPNVAERILEEAGSVGLGGERLPVVIFFSDIRGFTSMSERMDPDDVASLLSEYFTEMVGILFEHGGTLDKFMGDAIMALWGAPIAHEDDAERAMRTAMDQLAALDKLNERWAAEGRPRLEVGIGIDFGEVFAGNIGSDQRLEYTVLGDAVNTASRLCSNAGPGEILVTERFLAALRDPPEHEELPPIELKGKKQPVGVFRMVGGGEAPSVDPGGTPTAAKPAASPVDGQGAGAEA